MLALATALASFMSWSPAPAFAAPQQAAQCALSAADRTVSVRSYFRNTTPVVAELAPSTPVKVMEERAPWSKVQVPGGLVVYVHENYLAQVGDTGTVNANSVRARPLPSDGQESYPIGLFQKGDSVTVLGKSGPWYRVIAPESLAGWVETKDLYIIGAPTASWDKEWADARAARLTAVQAQAVSAAQPPVNPAIQAADPGQAPPAASFPADAGASAPPAGDAYRTLAEAEAALNQLIESGSDDQAEMDRLQSVFATVGLNGGDSLLVERAQNDQTRLEAYRKAKALERELAAQKAALDQQAADAEAEAHRRAQVPRPPQAVLETYQLTGWVAHKPGVYPACPFVVSNGAGDTPVLSVGNRYDLRDYIGREVAARGSFRPATVAGLRVLEITELRVLPTKK